MARETVDDVTTTPTATLAVNEHQYGFLLMIKDFVMYVG
jgi:hypothetical protein